MSKFKIEISSVPDREKLVAEIWHNEKLVAEINQDSENLEIEFYLNDRINFDLDELMEALGTAKRKVREGEM